MLPRQGMPTSRTCTDAAFAHATGTDVMSTGAEPPVILWHDKDAGVVLVNKPCGVTSTGRTVGDLDCVQGWLVTTLHRRRVWAVHQLDKDTTGANLFVLRKALVAEYSARLKAGRKRYLAVCHGQLDGPRDIRATVGRRLAPDGRSFPGLSADGRASHTHVAPISSTPTATLIDARPSTGRTHQIRLHLMSIGHPIFGEKLHQASPCQAHPRQALHCLTLGLGLNDGDDVIAELPQDLSGLLASEGLSRS